MSSPPVKYVRQADYTGYEGAHPTDTKSGVSLDADFGAVLTSLSQTIDRLAEIQRADGPLKNLIVTPDSLAPSTLALMVGTGVPRGAWLTLTAYIAKDIITQTGLTYICVTVHTSGVFATDLAASKWILFSDNLRIDLGNSGNVALGDALVAIKRTPANSVAITLHDWIEAFPVNSREFGVLANGADMVLALNNIGTDLGGSGGKIILPRGGISISDKIVGQTNVYIEGAGQGATIITSTGVNKSVYDPSDKSRCGLKGVSIIGGVATVTTPVINVVATTADVRELLLEDIYIESMGDNAIGSDVQSGATKIVYFPVLRNVNVQGGGAGVYQNKIAQRFGTVGMLPVVRPVCHGGRLWRTDYGIQANNVAELNWLGCMDDINGANGIGLLFGTATNCRVRAQMEGGTFKKYGQLGALTSYCEFDIPAVEPTTLQWIDLGTRNSLKGNTGSGGVPNYDGQARDFNGQVRIQSSADFVVYKDNWSNIQAPAAGLVTAGGNTGPITILGPRTNKTVMFEFSFYGRESTTNASWFLKGWGLACWGGANTILTYGIAETSEQGSTGMNAFGAYAIGTVVASASGNAVRIQLNNTGANNLNGVRYSVRSTEADT